MPIVTIKLVEGRTIEQKRQIAKKITETITEVANVKPEAVEIIFEEMKKENFAKAGHLLIDK